MKKVGMLLAIVIVVISLGGCMGKEDRIGKWIGTEQHMSDQIMEEIAEALDTRDAEALKKMFSTPALEEAEDLDQQISDLFEFYQGEMVSYKGFASSKTATNHGVETKEFIGTYQLITTEETYEVEYDHKPVDDENPEKTGLRKLELVTEEAYQEQVEVNEYYDWKHYDNDSGIYLQDK